MVRKLDYFTLSLIILSVLDLERIDERDMLTAVHHRTSHQADRWQRRLRMTL